MKGKEEEGIDWLPLAFLIYIQIYTIRALESVWAE